MDHLAAAARALADPPDRARALDHLVKAWRNHRQPAIATLVEALGAEISRARAPIDAELGDPDFHAAWLTRAAGADSLDLDLLIPGMFRGPLGKKIRERFDLLLPFADDPRVTMAFGKMIAEPPVTAASNFPLWTQLFAALARAPDIRLRTILETRLQQPGGGSQFWPMLHQRSLALLRELPTQLAEPSAAQREQISAIAARIAELAAAAPVAITDAPGHDDALEATLLDQIYANPEDIDARMVWADALSCRGDPRGEFTQLQLARRDTGQRPSKRERALLDTYELAWLGELAAAVERESLRYADGFPIAAEVWFDSTTERELIDSPAWATFRELDCDDPELIGRADLRSLRRAGGFGLATLRALVELPGPASPVEILGPIIVEQLPPFELDHLRASEAPRLAALRELWLHLDDHDLPRAPADYAWLFSTPLGERLRAFRLSSFPYQSYDERMPAWDQWLDASASPPWSALERLRLDMHPLSFEFDRSGARTTLRVRTRLSGVAGDTQIDEACAVLQTMRGRFDAVEFISQTNKALASSCLTELAAAAGFQRYAHAHQPQQADIGFDNWRRIRGLLARQQRASRRLKLSRRRVSGEAPKPKPSKPRRMPVAADVGFDLALGDELGAPNFRYGGALEFSADGRRLWALGGHLSEFAMPAMEQQWSLGARRIQFNCAAWDRARSRVFMGSYRGDTLLWDLDARRELGRARFHRVNVCAVAIAARHDLLLSTDQDRKLDTWRYESRGDATEPVVMIPLATHVLDDHAVAMVLSPDGETLALLGARGEVSLRSLDTLGHGRRIGRLGARASVLRWAPGGDHLVGARVGGELVIWDADGTELTRSSLHRQQVTALCWTPDGGALISAGERILVTDSETGGARLTIEGGRGTVRDMAVSPDGGVLAVGAFGGVSWWSLDDGRLLGRSG